MKQLGILSQGRLGNQMFEIAAAHKIAQDYGYQFVGMFYIPNHPQNSDAYISQKILGKCALIPLTEEYQTWTTYPNKVNSYILDPNFIPVNGADNLIITDLLQDAKYITPEIAKYYFQPYPSIKKEINELYGDVSNYVSINVRRGDYLKVADNYWNANDLQTVINTFFLNDTIIFTSDDIQWCKENFKGSKYIFADKPCQNKIEMDLYLQTQCRDNVVSNSTFSWWGAYLNENPSKKVIYPYPWMCLWKNKFQQIIPEGWIKYEWKNRY